MRLYLESDSTLYFLLLEYMLTTEHSDISVFYGMFSNVSYAIPLILFISGLSIPLEEPMLRGNVGWYEKG